MNTNAFNAKPLTIPIVILVLISSLWSFDADGVDLLGRNPYGYCPFVVADGDYLYSANGTVLQVLDIQTLQPVGEWVTESIVSSLAVVDGYVFIANWSDGFKVIDVGDPTNPHMIAEIDFPGQCWDLSVSGDHVYLGNNDEGLRIIDVSQPWMPTHVATFQPTEHPLFEYTQVIDTIAYAATQSGLYILDVSDPTAPEQLGYSPSEGGAWSVHVVDTVAYLPKFYDGIRMVNVADPGNPVEMGYFPTPGAASWIEIHDTLAYVAERFSGIQILNISDLTAPDSVGMVEMDFADAMFIQGDSMYIASSSWGLKSMDISDPLNPFILIEEAGGGYNLDVEFSGDYVYAAYRAQGIRIFQRTETDSLPQVGMIELDNPTKLTVRYNKLFAIDNGNLQIFDISDPTNPMILNTWEEGYVSGVATFRHYVYLAGHPDLQILDVSDPYNIQVVGSIDGLPSNAYEMNVIGGFIVLASRTGGLNIVDIRDPANPQLVGQYAYDMAYTWSVAVTGKYAFLAERAGNEIKAIDISDPSAMMEVGSYGGFSRIEAIQAFGRYVYALDSWDGVRVIDFGDPSNPQEVGYFNTGGYAKGLHVNNGTMAIGDGGGGLYLVDTWLNQPIFTVNSVGDGMDTNPGDGVCDDGSGDCTLRAAMNESNAYPGYNIIYFDIPGEGPHLLQPATPLPHVIDPVYINARTQPGWAGSPVVGVQGDNAGEANGLNLTSEAANSGVMALNISGFQFAGIRIESNLSAIIYCSLGTDISGVEGAGNNFGAEVFGSYNRFNANTISGNNTAGVNLVYSPDEGYHCIQNILAHNMLGTDPAGTFSIANNTGISVEGSNNMILSNTISGNEGNGIDLFGEQNIVVGNHIGLDMSGTYAIGNGNAGVMLIGSGNRVGGIEPGAGNVISGNLEGVTFASSEAGYNLVQGNFVGTDLSGTMAVPNSVGMLVLTSGNTIGGPAPEARNVISGNQWSGIGIGSIGLDVPTVDNHILGNYIGCDVTGTASLGNGVGVYMENAQGNLVGGTDPSARNVISGNQYHGVHLSEGTNYNLVQGNFVGTDHTGTQNLANSRFGVRISRGGSYNLIGGPDPGQGNVISCNSSGGIGLGWDGGAFHNTVQGNIIGTDFGWEYELGNGVSGIAIFGGASNNLIGGMQDGEENIIIHNANAGVSINNSSNELNNSILRNIIYGNGEIGIDLSTNTNFPYTDGVTQNDPGDGDEGPNHFQNYPEDIMVWINESGNLFIEYRVDSDTDVAVYPMHILFFLSDEDGEGNWWLAEDSYTVADHNTGLKAVDLGPAVDLGIEVGHMLVATATDAEGNTSEFSEIAVIPPVGLADQEMLPTEYVLLQNFPNPFNPETTIRYGLPVTTDVSVVIYDLQGRMIRTYSESGHAAGWVNIHWDGSNASGEKVSTGVYLCRMVAGDYSRTIKMVYMK